MSEQQEFRTIALESGTYETRVTKKFTQRKPYEKNNPGIIKALIPGVVAEVDTQVGTAVKKGDTLMILEAMKMLNTSRRRRMERSKRSAWRLERK